MFWVGGSVGVWGLEVLHLEAGRSGVQVCHVRPVHHLHTARQAQQQRGLRGGAERDARLWVDVGPGARGEGGLIGWLVGGW